MGDYPQHGGGVDALALLGGDGQELDLAFPALRAAHALHGHGESQEARGFISPHPDRLGGNREGSHERCGLLAVVNAQ